MGVIARSLCVVAVIAASSTAFAKTDDDGSREVSAQRRVSVTVTPTRSTPGPNATRHCDAWLEKEYRPSGTVVVPRMNCVWR
ncbi:MAG TPA: hypothetical protein VHD59_16415 [Pseudolabrys sp.]|jgi:hypothetical protein|nr:hypothetical protein [Pseudolabrys sp.]